MGRRRFGIFAAPSHPVSRNPSPAVERDFELVQWPDRRGFDETWIGERPSAGAQVRARRPARFTGRARRQTPADSPPTTRDT